jgi:hypothetical protein
MTTHIETRLEIKSWDEKPYRELSDGRKFSRADVALTVAEDGIEADATSEMLVYYHADDDSGFVGLMHIAGRLGDRSGGFVLQGTGSYDGTTAQVEYTIVPGSGTGELADVRGTAVSVSTHSDYPFMPLTLDYEVP